MEKFNWIDISREDVIRAIEKFVDENPEYPEPRSTFLIYNGKKLPAKHIRGMAYAVHYGVEISKSDFGGGMETVRFFERLGFKTEYKKTTMDKAEHKEEEPKILKSIEKVIIPSKQVIEGQKLIIEYDERQHFSEARKLSLEAYMGVPVCFDRNLWMKACDDIGAKDNAPKNRDEIRAYYDSTRDIESYKHGYRLVRIMHGQIDFKEADAAEKLKKIILEEPAKIREIQNRVVKASSCKTLKVCMYLQTEEKKNKTDFDSAMEIVKKSDIDLLVFPEFCYMPDIHILNNADMGEQEDVDAVFDMCIKLSECIGKAVIVNGADRYGSICSVFANAYANEMETECSYYMKHTMTECSMFEFANYQELVKNGLFEPILFKGFKLGLTICYDCNHAIFSRMYELCGGVDLIVNSTGGDVIYDKWFKYNKARAIENSCYTVVTMGGDGNAVPSKNYVYGFDASGGMITPVNLNGSSGRNSVSGGLYVYEVMGKDGNAEDDNSNITETVNKKWQFEVPVGNIETVLKQAEKIADSLYKVSVGGYNVILCLVEGMDIMKPEKVLPLLYAPEIKKYHNCRYIIVNRHGCLDEKVFREKLSIILKVRSMENFCAVVLKSENINKCYQCGKNRTAQVVKAVNGKFGIDLDRTSGPEAIWKNKQGMKANWRTNFEWLVNYAAKL